MGARYVTAENFTDRSASTWSACARYTSTSARAASTRALCSSASRTQSSAPSGAAAAGAVPSSAGEAVAGAGVARKPMIARTNTGKTSASEPKARAVGSRRDAAQSGRALALFIWRRPSACRRRALADPRVRTWRECDRPGFGSPWPASLRPGRGRRSFPLCSRRTRRPS